MSDYTWFTEAREVVRTLELVSEGGGTFRIEVTRELHGTLEGFAARYYEKARDPSSKELRHLWVDVPAPWVHATSEAAAMAQAKGFLRKWISENRDAHR